MSSNFIGFLCASISLKMGDAGTMTDKCKLVVGKVSSHNTLASVFLFQQSVDAMLLQTF